MQLSSKIKFTHIVTYSQLSNIVDSKKRTPGKINELPDAAVTSESDIT